VSLSKLLKLLVFLLVATIAALLYPPIRLSALVLAGRSPVCPLKEAIKSEENARRQIAIKDDILKNSKVIANDGEYEQWQTPLGVYWIPAKSRYSLHFNLAEMKRRIYGSGTHFVQRGDVVLDCGANVGTFTRQALNAGADKVIAIEPAPENLECLRRAFAPEISSGRVVVYPKGVWDKDDVLSLNTDHDNSAADSFVMHPEGEDHASAGEALKLPVTTIDHLVAELKLERVNFIKMDIEGAEPKALAGGRDTMARFHPRLSVSVYHVPDHPVVVPQVIKQAWSGYALECGPCAVSNARIRPDILYFR
jgi:FkbM family methyltransferase